MIVFALTHTHMDVPTRENGQVMAEWFHKVGCQWTVLLVSVLTARFTTSSLLHPINVWLYGGHKMALVHCKKRDKYPGNSSLSLLDPQSSSLYMPLSSNLTSPVPETVPDSFLSTYYTTCQNWRSYTMMPPPPQLLKAEWGAIGKWL